MSLNPNQFNMIPVQGGMDLQFGGSVFSFAVDASQATALVAGQPVLLYDRAVPLPTVVGLAANTDNAFGFVVRNLKDATFPANSRVEIATSGSVMYMTAGAAIARGAKIEVVYNTNKVITNAGTNPVAGYALDKAAADGDLIRVYVINSATSAQVIADIAGLQNALDALGESGTPQAVTALTTAGAGTITAAGIVSGVTARSGPTAAFTDTTDTGTAISTAYGASVSTGDAFYYTYQNNTAFQATIAGGSSVTPSVQTVVQGNSWVKYLMTCTGTNTWSMVAVAAGAMNNTLYNTINKGAKVCTAQVDRATSTTLTNVTGCAVALLAAGTYIFKAHISGTATANGGAKAAIAGDGTLSATSFTCTGTNWNATTPNAKTTTTTLGTAVGAATAVLTDLNLEGVIVVNAAGVLNLQIAQNASHADTTSAYANSYLEVTRVA